MSLHVSTQELNSCPSDVVGPSGAISRRLCSLSVCSAGKSSTKLRAGIEGNLETVVQGTQDSYC